MAGKQKLTPTSKYGRQTLHKNAAQSNSPSHKSDTDKVHGSTNNNFNREKKQKSATHHERAPQIHTSGHEKKTVKTMQELIDGLERSHPYAINSKLPRAVHKPSILAAMDRQHNQTSGEMAQQKQQSGEDFEYSAHDIEKLVKDQIYNIQDKIDSLRDNLSKCSQGLEVIQQEQCDLFERYEIFLGRGTPDSNGRKRHKEGVTLPPISQRTCLTTSDAKGGHNEWEFSMISNIKKIARKRSNEQALRETESDVLKESHNEISIKQTASNEELRKSTRLNKAREAVRRAAVQHFRKREKSVAHSTESQDTLTKEILRKGESTIAHIIRAHDKLAKTTESQKK